VSERNEKFKVKKNKNIFIFFSIFFSKNKNIFILFWPKLKKFVSFFLGRNLKFPTDKVLIMWYTTYIPSLEQNEQL